MGAMTSNPCACSHCASAYVCVLCIEVYVCVCTYTCLSHPRRHVCAVRMSVLKHLKIKRLANTPFSGTSVVAARDCSEGVAALDPRVPDAGVSGCDTD